jgi:hypothetical protein
MCASHIGSSVKFTSLFPFWHMTERKGVDRGDYRCVHCQRYPRSLCLYRRLFTPRLPISASVQSGGSLCATHCDRAHICDPSCPTPQSDSSFPARCRSIPALFLATACTLLSSYSRAMLFMGQDRKTQKLYGYADIMHAHRHAVAKPADS